MVRQSAEHKIIQYFQSTPLASANAIFGIVKGTMQDRNLNQDSGSAVKRRKKTVRKPRAAASADPAASVDPAAPKPRRGRPKVRTDVAADPIAQAAVAAEPVPSSGVYPTTSLPVEEMAGAAV